MALKEEVMGELSYMNLKPMSLVLTVLEPNLHDSLRVLACPQVHLVLEPLLTTICDDISNGMSDWVLIPPEIETHTAHGQDNDYNDNVKGKHFSAPLV